MGASINQISNKIELHYFFSDDSHTMDATIRNKCEHEYLEIIKQISEVLNIELSIESEAYLEGGLKEWLTVKIKKYPILSVIVSGVLINVISTPLITDNELVELQKQELRLSIEHLKQELQEDEKTVPTINIENLTLVLNNDIKIIKHKSNFYKNLSSYSKVTKIETAVLSETNEPIEKPNSIERSEFSKFILVSDDLPAIIDDGAVIEIISPVLKRGSYKWKGLYKGEIIDFYMKDAVFKESVIQDREPFVNGTFIECVLEISQKIDDFGEVKNSSYSVLTVIKKDDGEATILTKQGKKYKAEQKAKEQQLSFNFGETSNE